jgi:Leucine carboxyl methyltransferase
MDGINWWECDFDAVVSEKRKIISSGHSFKTLFEKKSVHWISSPASSSSSPSSPDPPDGSNTSFGLFPVDLRDIKQLHSLVNCPLDPTLPTLFLSECVLAYLTAEAGSSVIQWAGATFPDSYFLTYEQILPNDPFGQMMIQNLNSRFPLYLLSFSFLSCPLTLRTFAFLFSICSFLLKELLGKIRQRIRCP